MKKVNFTLKLTGPTGEMTILHNGNKLQKFSNYKKALKFIALFIHHKNIENFDLFVFEKNRLQKLNNFDPETILNYGNKLGRSSIFDDDDDDFDLDEKSNLLSRKFGEDDDFNSSRMNFDKLRNRRGPTWRYSPTDNSSDLETIKNSLKNLAGN